MLPDANGWKYYQHSLIREDYETPIEKKSFHTCLKEWQAQGCGEEKPFFAEYITEFDCAEPTQWWFTIKDDEYDLSHLPAKRRYEITKAHKFCKAEKINPLEYKEELFYCYKRAFDAYPEKYRPTNFNDEEFFKSLENWQKSDSFFVYASFYKEKPELVGFLLVQKKGRALKLVMQKTNPDFEKYNSNAALIDCMLTDWNEKLKSGEVYVTNGSRSIKHETNFNAYLEKYFGFRKAYAKLCVVYRFPFGIAIKVLRPFRKLLAHTKNPLLYNVYCVLKMDSFAEGSR